MIAPGARRDLLRAQLTAAYGDGLLSPGTFTHRIEVLVHGQLLLPESLVGDLSVRVPRRRLPRRLVTIGSLLLAHFPRRHRDGALADLPLLALDWTGAVATVLVGRDPGCDVVLSDAGVSRRHAQLDFRDGSWVLRDLGSRNGTRVNGVSVERCRLLAGDRLTLGGQPLVVD